MKATDAEWIKARVYDPHEGNETGCSLVSPGCTKFTIPMRGNEVKITTDVTANLIEVYDPHEG